ncbi:MAG: hypothetical protein AABX10_00300 [Nanoarchaeota archaeon]
MSFYRQYRIVRDSDPQRTPADLARDAISDLTNSRNYDVHRRGGYGTVFFDGNVAIAILRNGSNDFDGKVTISSDIVKDFSDAANKAQKALKGDSRLVGVED